MMNSVKSLLSLIRENLDSALALAGVLFSIVLTFFLQVHFRNVVYTICGALSFLACVTYLVMKWRNKLSPISSIINVEAKPWVLLLLDIAYFAMFSASLLFFAARSEAYVIPLGYYISIALMSAIVAAKILVLPSKNSVISITLVQVILIGLSLEWTTPAMFASIVGLDPWYHQKITLEMLSQGHIVDSYSNAPVMQLVIGTTSLITTLSYKFAAMLSVSTLQVICDSLFVFLIGKFLVNSKIGMLAALLLGIANFHVFFGYWIIPNMLGAVFVLIIVYLVLRFHRDRIGMILPLCGILATAILLTHSIATLWLAILLFTFWVVFFGYKWFFKVKLATLANLVIAVIFVVAMLGWWNYGTTTGGSLATLIGNNFNPTSLKLTLAPGTAPQSTRTSPSITPPSITPPPTSSPTATPPPTSSPTATPPVTSSPTATPPLTSPASTPPVTTLPVIIPSWETLSEAPFELLFNSSGMLIYFAGSFIGCLYLLSRKGNVYSFYITIAGLLILGIGFFPMLAGFSVIEHRWWYLAEILLSVPLAIAIYLLSGLFGNSLLKVGTVVVLVFIIAFLSIMGLPDNQTNRTFSKNQIVTFGFATSEIDALRTVSTNFDGTIGIDELYSAAIGTPGLFANRSKLKIYDIQPYLLNGNFIQVPRTLVLIRNEVVRNPIGTGSGAIYKLNYDPRQVLIKQGSAKVYDSASVTGFVLNGP